MKRKCLFWSNQIDYVFDLESYLSKGFNPCSPKSLFQVKIG